MRVSIAFLLMAGVLGSAFGADESTKTFNIPAQPLAEALADFSRQSDVIVLAPSPLTGNKISKSVTGEMSPTKALEQLLEGTDLHYVMEQDGSVILQGRVTREDGEAKGASLVVAQAEAAEATDLPAGQGDGDNTNVAEPEQDSLSGKLEEVVVTAQKRQERALDVPISITALEGQQLEDFRIRDTQDLSFFVPSLTVTEVGPGMGHIAIRGLGSERGNSSLTGIYIDEAAVAASPVFPIEPSPVDLERVEVLKGPQGTLYGEGSTGGTIRYITRAPDLTDFSARGEISAYDTKGGGVGEELTTVLNAPLVQDKLGVRLVGYFENGSGWIDRPATASKDINDNELVDIRTRVLWQPVEALSLNGTVIVHRNNAGAQNVVNLEPRSESNFVTEVDPTAPTDVDDDYNLYSLTGRYDFGSVSLLSASSYVDMDKEIMGQSQLAMLDFPSFGGVVTFSALSRDWIEKLDVFSQELRLSSNGNEQLQWTIGGFYRDSEVLRDRVQDTIFAGFPGQGGGLEFDKSQSWAAFGDASYQLTERLSIGAGLRYFYDDRERQSAGGPGLPLSSGALAGGSFDNLSSRVYASYALSNDANVYVSRSEGFRSGGFNDASSVAGGAPLDFDPELLAAYELGTKMSLLSGRLHAELAIFYNEFTDIQYLGVVPGGFSLPYTSNVGEAEMKGFDWSLRWRATSSLTLGFAGDVIDTEVTEVRATGTAQNVGDPIDFVSDYTLSFTADYGFRWAESVPGVVRAVYNQKGPATQTLRGIGLVDFQDESATVNFLSGEVGAVLGGVTVGLFGNNLLNEDEKLRPGVSGWTAQARPRTFGVRVSAEF